MAADSSTPPSPIAAAASHGPDRAVAPWLIRVVTALLFAATAWRFGVSWALPAFLYLAAAAVVLTITDLQHQRLPNALVGFSAVAALVLLLIAAAGTRDWSRLLQALVGGTALFVVFLVLAILAGSMMGMGDVKLAFVLGLYLSFLSVRALVLGAAGAFVLSALITLGLLLTRRVGRRSLVPFGPSMIAAAVAVVVCGLS